MGLDTCLDNYDRDTHTTEGSSDDIARDWRIFDAIRDKFNIKNITAFLKTENNADGK